MREKLGCEVDPTLAAAQEALGLESPSLVPIGSRVEHLYPLSDQPLDAGPPGRRHDLDKTVSFSS